MNGTHNSPPKDPFMGRLMAVVLSAASLMLLARFLFFSTPEAPITPTPSTAAASSSHVAAPPVAVPQPRPAPTATSPQAVQPSGALSGVVAWQDARQVIGQRATVEGTIVATHNSGKACFLNFHRNYRRHFTAVIFRRAFDRFPNRPEDHYRGKRVRVTGLVKEYKGKPEIILNDSSQIEVMTP